MEELQNLKCIPRTWFEDIGFKSGESLLFVVKLLDRNKVSFEYLGKFFKESLRVLE